MRLVNTYGKPQAMLPLLTMNKKWIERKTATTTSTSASATAMATATNKKPHSKITIEIEDRSMSICSSYVYWYGLEETFSFVSHLPIFFSRMFLFCFMLHKKRYVYIGMASYRTRNGCVVQHRFTRCYRKLIVENCLLSHLLLVH